MLNKLGKKIVKINKANGWNIAKPKDWISQYKIPAMLALITSETSETLEAFRNRDYENFNEECADQIIRVLDLMSGLGIDIDKIIFEIINKQTYSSLNEFGQKNVRSNKASIWDTKPCDWKSQYNIPAKLAIITSETSKALEAFKALDYKNFIEKCAYQIISILDLTTGLKIDIDKAIYSKIEINKKRGYKHGGKKI